MGPTNTSLLAEVGPGGALTLPCVSARASDRLLSTVPTLDALREAAAEPTQVKRYEPQMIL